MSRKLTEDVQNIILNFLGIIDYSMTGCCHAFTKKGKRCKSKPASDFVFCRKHKDVIRKLSNGDDLKEIAIAYLLIVYKGPNRKKITSNGIICKKVQEVPVWVGGLNSGCNIDYFYKKRIYEGYKKSRCKRGYCICPWCIEQYFKFFNRYSDRIIKIRQMIHYNSYPYNSTIDLFNNNVVRINETIKKKNKDKSVGFWRHKMIPKKRLLNQFNFWNHFDNGTATTFYCGEFPLKYIVSKSYTECANNTKFETQYMKGGGPKWSGNYHRLQNTCPLVAFSSYEMINIVLFKKIIKNYRIELPETLIRYICSYFYEKSIFKKSFLHKKRILYWKLVDKDRNFWIKVDENGEPIRPNFSIDGLDGLGGRL